MYSEPDTLAGGLPHSEIPGSTIARISPGLIAACHALHRLSVPRHPPDALFILNLTQLSRHSQGQDPEPWQNASREDTLYLKGSYTKLSAVSLELSANRD